MNKPNNETRSIVLSGGVIVPYPSPVSDRATKMGQGNTRVDTKPELALRSKLHQRGLRFRKNLGIRAGRLLTHPDIVFTRSRTAVFVDGCFWHGCGVHGTTPKSNVEYWSPKLAGNKVRDSRVNEALTEEGWLVIRCWEHEDPSVVADRICREIGKRMSTPRRPVGER